MNASFHSFAIGLILSVVLRYLILVAQFRSFTDPCIILLALPPGITGVIVALLLWGTPLNVMSLMGVLMLVGIALSNSILIVEFANHLIKEGMGCSPGGHFLLPCPSSPDSHDVARDGNWTAANGSQLGEGSESYTPLAQAIIGGLVLSVLFTIFLIPAGFLLVYRETSA